MKNKIIKYLLKRFTDYYALKSEIKKLNQDIDSLVFSPDSFASMVIKDARVFKRSLMKILWIGDIDHYHHHIQGLLNPKHEN